MEDATAAKNHCNGIEIDERRVRVDFSVTQRAHSPTPGYYQGKPTRREERERGMRSEKRRIDNHSYRPARRDDRERRHEEPSRDRRHAYSPPRAPRTPPPPQMRSRPRYEERDRRPQRNEYEDHRKSNRYERPSNGFHRRV